MNLFIRAICTAFAMLVLGGTTALASPMTIQAAEGNVRSLLMGAARMGGLDLVMDDAVGGTVSLSLTAEPEEIIDYIAAAKGLVVLKEQGVYLITLPGRGSRSIHVYTLHHADPREIARMAKNSLTEKSGAASTASDNVDKVKGSKKNTEPRAEDAESVRVMADPSTNSASPLSAAGGSAGSRKATSKTPIAALSAMALDLAYWAIMCILMPRLMPW